MFDRSSSPKPSKSLTDFVPGSLDQSSLPMLEPPSYATPNATKSLNRALKEVLDIQKKTPLHELGWYIDQELISNIYQWIVELHSFDSSLPLTKDMKAAGLTSVVLEIRFGKDFPFSPPFVRVIRPRFLPFMNGGGGHVTAGGAMCMELLTNSGWSAVSTIESVLLQVRMAIMNTEPKPARLESQGRLHQRDYGTGEAIDAYIRACRAHGWQVPPDFNDFAVSGASGY
jgi:ubiquitin-protein ligase